MTSTTAHDNAAAVFAQLGRELGLSGPELADATTATITFSNGVGVVVSLDDERSRIVFESDLGPWPNADERLLRVLLKNNHVWSDPAVQFSLRPTDDSLVAFRSLEAPTATLDALLTALSVFVQGTAHWADVLRRLQTGESPPPAAELVPAASLRI